MDKKIWVVKIGGAVAENDHQLQEIFSALVTLKHQSISVILVHGGGKAINRHLQYIQEEPIFIQGLRKTTPLGMEMVEMTLSGLINKKLVRMYTEAGKDQGILVLGLSGSDLNLFQCEVKNPQLGQVGSIHQVNFKNILPLLEQGIQLVVSPVSTGPKGLPYNVNADEAAGALAAALQVEKLIYISDVPGVLDSQGAIIEYLNQESAQQFMEQNIIQGGMIPKVNSCFAQLKSGVKEVQICGWPGLNEFEERISHQRPLGTSVSL